LLVVVPVCLGAWAGVEWAYWGLTGRGHKYVEKERKGGREGKREIRGKERGIQSGRKKKMCRFWTIRRKRSRRREGVNKGNEDS